MKKTNEQIETTDEYEIKTLTNELRGLAKEHKNLDNKLSKESPSLFFQEIRSMKARLAEFRKIMNRKIRRLEKLGGVWDDEIERISVGMVA